MNKKKIDLTPRQLEVLRLIVLGKTNKTISDELCVTEHTVKAHITQIFIELGVSNRTEAAIKAKDEGLIPDQDSEQP